MLIASPFTTTVIGARPVDPLRPGITDPPPCTVMFSLYGRIASLQLSLHPAPFVWGEGQKRKDRRGSAHHVRNQVGLLIDRLFAHLRRGWGSGLPFDSSSGANVYLLQETRLLSAQTVRHKHENSRESMRIAVKGHCMEQRQRELQYEYVTGTRSGSWLLLQGHSVPTLLAARIAREGGGHIGYSGDTVVTPVAYHYASQLCRKMCRMSPAAGRFREYGA